MNIQRAKEEIVDSIHAYLRKDEYGDYCIPTMNQRPILLLGAPGIGKTQIMAQIAAQCEIALVSYTITHHTRQSAIGLPFISKKSFGGEEVPITEYTMSEIVASLYQKMEKTGLSEGILFIDEINCVSETLAPAMLQFLQYKTFGSHQIPPGWVIIAAGNPPEYNKSVRDFDVVTLDRIRKIEVEPDFTSWKAYAYQVGINPAILSYLTSKPQHFYRMETTVDGKAFATPRGWEDLSRIMKVYAEMGLPTTRDVVIQYIQHPVISKDFANYLELYEKYEAGYQIDEVMKGHIEDILLKKIAHASFDERLSVISLLLSRVTATMNACLEREELLAYLHPRLVVAKEEILENGKGVGCLQDALTQIRQERDLKHKAELLSPAQKAQYRKVEDFYEGVVQEIQKAKAQGAPLEADETFRKVQKAFGALKDAYDQAYDAAGEALEHAFDFLEAAFNTGQELVIFITELNQNRQALKFLETYACERYYQYNKNLLYEDRGRVLLRRIEALE